MLGFYRENHFLFLAICLLKIGWITGSGNTDSATIRAIESEVRRVKGTSDNIFGELKKQKDTTTALQNEFKWLHNELKGMKKTLADVELLINQTIRNDTEYIRGKITDLSNFIFNVGKVNTPAKPLNSTHSTIITNNGTTTPSPVPTTTTTKKFRLLF